MLTDNPTVLSTAQMRQADQLTIQAGTSGFALLSSAGSAVFEAIQAQINHKDEILICCGVGNNGGDGLILAARLHAEGYTATVMMCGDVDAVTGDARKALDLLPQTVAESEDIELQDFTVIIDAMLGAGLSRPVSDELASWVEAINTCDAKVYAVDIPTGINGDTGQALGAAIQADKTITFFLKKPGHLLMPGRQFCGEVAVVQIGILDSVLDSIRPTLFENNPLLWQQRLPVPTLDAHKYTRGHAVVLSGGANSTGAGRLGARAALRVGAGLVTLGCPPEAASVNAAHLTAEMLRVVDSATAFEQWLQDARITSVLLGPGLGVNGLTQDLVKVALQSTAAVVLDADALSVFASDPDMLFSAVAASSAQVVLTPHQGEFTRLFADLTVASNSPGDDSLSKTEQTTHAAVRSHCVVINKGADTVIASPSGDTVINTNAPPWLATAGSGDVLAGTVCGLLAQGVDAFDAACAASWIHGAAAADFGPGLIATDIAEQYPSVLVSVLPLN